MPAPRLVSDAQFETLVEFMEENRALALGQSSSMAPMEKQQLTQRWEELATTLNSIAGVTKTARRWREYWSEKKYGVRKKASGLQLSRIEKRTAKMWDMTPLEERIINILGKVPVRANQSVKILIKSQPANEPATEPATELATERATKPATQPATKPVVTPPSPLPSVASKPHTLKYSKLSDSDGRCDSLPACIQSIESNTAATKRFMEATQRSVEATQRSVEAIQTSTEATQRSITRIEMLLENVLTRWIP